MKYYIGIDLGGTNIKAGVVNEEFEIIAKATCKTNLPAAHIPYRWPAVFHTMSLPS